MRCLIFLFVLGCLLPAQAAGGVESQEGLTLRRLTSKSSARHDEDLDETIRRVRASFVERDTAKLADSFSSKKVYVSLRPAGQEAGYYSRSQLQFILDKMFRDLRTRSFEYLPSDIRISEDGRAYFRSEWTYVVLGSDTVVTEHLHFLFEKEKDRWRISEIKATSR